ncbi:MAG TPA: hypothetical protein VFA46_11385 [Actinomycetes bacterium]|nr:hypothetical protein [Actinomycetes bacterium]
MSGTWVSRRRSTRGDRALALMAVALGLALVASACGGGSGTGTAAPAAAPGSVDLKGICPDPVVVQTNWFPQSEHGAVYQLLGAGATIDAAHRRVTGPLLAGGRSTGVRIQVRAGGPAVGFQSSAALMYQDPAITLGMLQSDEIIQTSKTQPVVGVVAPLELDPQMIMWDPATHPGWHTIADIGQTDAKVLYFQTGTYMEYLLGSGILRRRQVDGSYDGSPAAFVASGGKIAVQGYATNEPYTYQHEVSAWGRKVAYQLVYDTGYPNYGNVLTVRADTKATLSLCLRRLVPIIQQAQADFMRAPAAAIELILKLDRAYKGGFVYSRGNAEFAVQQLRGLGIVANGTDTTLGNFDYARLGRLLAIVAPIFSGQRKPIRPDLSPAEVGTNEFIDTSIGLK